jgi:WD40 repeat protein
MSGFEKLDIACAHTWSVESFINLAVALSGDGLLAMTCGEADVVSLWDLDKNEFPIQVKGHRAEAVCVAISDDGTRALSGDTGGTICFWDSDAAKLICELRGHEDRISKVAFLPDVKSAISGSWDGTLRVWDLERRQCKSVLKGHTKGITAVAVTPNGRFAVSSSFDSTVRVWELATFCQTTELPGHHDKVMAVAIAANGRRLASGGSDGTLALSDFPVTKLRTLGPLDKGISSLGFGSNGTMLFIAHNDGTVRLLDTVGQELTTLIEFRGRLPSSVSVGCDIALARDERRLLVGRAGSLGIFDVTLPPAEAEARSRIQSLGDLDGPIFPDPPTGKNSSGMRMITRDENRSRILTRLVVVELSNGDLDGRAQFHFGFGDVYLMLRDGTTRKSLGTMFSMNVGSSSSESVRHALLLSQNYSISVDGESTNLDDPGAVAVLSDDPYDGPLCQRSASGSVFVMAFPATTPFEDAVALTIGDIEITIDEKERMTTRPTARDEFSKWVLQLERILNDRAKTIVAGLAEDTPSPQSIWSSNSSLNCPIPFDTFPKHKFRSLILDLAGPRRGGDY